MTRGNVRDIIYMEKTKSKASYKVWSQFCKNWCQDFNITESIINTFSFILSFVLQNRPGQIKSVSITEINKIGFSHPHFTESSHILQQIFIWSVTQHLWTISRWRFCKWLIMSTKGYWFVTISAVCIFRWSFTKNRRQWPRKSRKLVKFLSGNWENDRMRITNQLLFLSKHAKL